MCHPQPQGWLACTGRADKPAIAPGLHDFTGGRKYRKYSRYGRAGALDIGQLSHTAS